MKKVFAILTAAVITASIFAGCSPKENVVINSAEDLNSKKIGVQAGTTGESWVRKNTTATVTPYKSGIDAALELKNGAIEAVVLDELPAKSIVAANDDLEILDIKFTKEEYAIAVKKGNAELLAAIDETITEMKNNGEYEDLVNAFMPADGNIKVPESNNTSTGSKVIKMGTNAAFPPFEYLDGTKIVGFDVSMGEKIADKVGGKLEISNIEFDALIPALQAGSIDFIAAGMSVDEERKKNVDFSVPYFESEQVIIVRK